jgi:hypothetical protein
LYLVPRVQELSTTVEAIFVVDIIYKVLFLFILEPHKMCEVEETEAITGYMTPKSLCAFFFKCFCLTFKLYGFCC